MSSELTRALSLLQAVSTIGSAALVVVAFGFHVFHSIHGSSVRFNTPYQADC